MELEDEEIELDTAKSIEVEKSPVTQQNSAPSVRKKTKRSRLPSGDRRKFCGF